VCGRLGAAINGTGHEQVDQQGTQKGTEFYTQERESPEGLKKVLMNGKAKTDSPIDVSQRYKPTCSCSEGPHEWRSHTQGFEQYQEKPRRNQQCRPSCTICHGVTSRR
jgi:hypothetical protein